MHLDIYSFYYVSRKTKTTHNLKWRCNVWIQAEPKPQTKHNKETTQQLYYETNDTLTIDEYGVC
jgi:hypothetical protein